MNTFELILNCTQQCKHAVVHKLYTTGMYAYYDESDRAF